MATELEMALHLSLQLSEDELCDFTVGAQVDDDFAFSLFHESDEEVSPPDDTISVNKAVLTGLEVKSIPPDQGVSRDSRSAEESITFVEKTYYMVNSSTKPLVCWNATGTGFLVVDTDRFSREVLPDYFKHHSMSKFVTDLTLHGFRKASLHHERLGIKCMEFRHPHFLRGNVEQLAKIERRVPGTRLSKTACSIAIGISSVGDADPQQETVSDIRFQISALQCEVQQTQHLFDKLLVSLIHQHALQPNLAFMMPTPSLTPPCFHQFDVTPVSQGFFAPAIFSVGSPVAHIGPLVPTIQPQVPIGEDLLMSL